MVEDFLVEVMEGRMGVEVEDSQEKGTEADMLEAGTKFAIVSTALDVAARVGTRSADQHGQCVTPLAHSLAIGP